MSEETVSLEDTMSFHQARERLRNRLQASDFEVWEWIQAGRIELYGQDGSHKCTILAHERTGISGSLPEDPDTERYLREGIHLRRFLRQQIESFDPARQSPIEGEPDLADYPSFFAVGFLESHDFGFNPSGRFVSFRETIGFLSEFAQTDEVIKHLRLETDQYRLHGYGFDGDPPLEESYFPESEIVALATVIYERKFDGWDAVTCKRATGDVLNDKTFPQRAKSNELIAGEDTISSHQASARETKDFSQPSRNTSRSVDCLPNPPKRKDDWYVLIREAVKAFVKEKQRCPNETEMWAQLYNNPPSTYGTEKTTDYGGETALSMGTKFLPQSAFFKRWRRYTETNNANSGQ